MAVEWKEHLATGIRQIDVQHQELFRQFNLLMNAIDGGKGATQVLEVLGFLDDYTVAHFHDEEMIMMENSYPYLELHRGEHAQFRRDLERLKSRITTEGFTQQNIKLTSRTLLRWLIQHICTTDKALADHLHGRKRRIIVPPQPSPPPP